MVGNKSNAFLNNKPLSMIYSKIFLSFIKLLNLLWEDKLRYI